VDFDALVQKAAPKDFDLLALADGIGGDKCRLNLGILRHDAGGFDIPVADVIQQAVAFDMAADAFEVVFLLFGLVGRADKGRIAEDVIRRLPRCAEAVGVDDFGGVFERQRMAGNFAVEADLRADVALVVFEPHGSTGDKNGKFVYFDAVELFQTALDGRAVKQAACFVFEGFGDDVVFKGADAVVGNDKEIAAAAGRVEELQVFGFFGRRRRVFWLCRV
ncbi:hypothetical protein NEISUBOT_04042, partial [Neisseria subflava NJ9703]